MEELEENEVEPFDWYEPNGKHNIEDIFDYVIGQNNLKKNLIEYISEIENGEKLIEEGRHSYKGFLILSDKALGKSFILDQIAYYGTIDTLKYNAEGNLIDNLKATFEKAHELKKCLILIDDIDYCASYDENFLSAFKGEMNGIDEEENILVIATASDADKIYDAYLFNASYFNTIQELKLTYYNLIEIFKQRVNDFEINLSDDFNFEYLTDILYGLKYNDYKSIDRILNDVKLKYGKEIIDNITIEKVIYEYVFDKDISLINPSWNVCVHEAAHACFSILFDGYVRCAYAKNDDEGLTIYAPGNGDARDLKEDIMQSLAGNISEAFFCGKDTAFSGNNSDLVSARRQAHALISDQGYNRYSDVLFPLDDKEYKNSEYKLKRIDKKVDHLIDKLAYKTKKIIKRNSGIIALIAIILRERIIVSGTEIKEIYEECKKHKWFTNRYIDKHFNEILLNHRDEIHNSLIDFAYFKNADGFVITGLENKSLEKIIIPDNVTSIGRFAFSKCKKITSVTISDSVDTIDRFAFECCKKMTNIEIPDSVKYIENHAFYNCTALESVIIPNSVNAIEDGTFDCCRNLTKIVIPGNVTTIGDYAFYLCDKLTKVYYKGTPTEWKNISIGSWNSSLTSATRYYYSDEEPTDTDNHYWHYVDDIPTEW